MFQVKFNQQYSVVFNTIFGIGLILVSLMVASLAAYAGPQSLLDPYANISPENVKSDSKLAKKKVVKRLFSKKESGSEQTGNNTNNELSDSETKSSDETKSAKASKIKISKSDNAGFLSGVKEIQHGSITSIKAASKGIISVSKVAGVKVAAGTKVISSSVASAGSKVISGDKAPTASAQVKKAPAIADAGALSGNPRFPVLPGKPLDQAVAQEKQRKHLKDVPVTGEEVRKPGIITSAVDKLNFFHKAKKSPSANMTANKAGAGAQ